LLAFANLILGIARIDAEKYYWILLGVWLLVVLLAFVAMLLWRVALKGETNLHSKSRFDSH
jgi:hypothetical protein